MELGLVANTNKRINVVCDDDFWRRGNIEVICERYNIPLYNSLSGFLNLNKR
jgi:hypothetical protein